MCTQITDSMIGRLVKKPYLLPCVLYLLVCQEAHIDSLHNQGAFTARSKNNSPAFLGTITSFRFRTKPNQVLPCITEGAPKPVAETKT